MHPNMRNANVRAALLGTTMLASAVAFTAVPAVAQDDSMIETVTVTGIRASLQSAQAIKQNSDQVVDSITAVDIGALPDRSVAEALQRVPGVQVTRTDAVKDPLRWAGYGNGVFIRGLSWVSSLTNGFETFGAENGRTISFADISPSLMSGVDVYKNPDATMIEGGVGGVVNLKTRKPFDADGLVIAAGADLAYGTISNKMAPSVNILVSDRWQTKIGDVGLLISADYQDLRASNSLASLGAFTGTGTTSGGETVYYPVGLTSDEQVGYRHMDWKQPRVALDATLQWRPTDRLELTAMVIWSKAEPMSYEHNVAWDLYGAYPGGSTAYWQGLGGAANALDNYKYDSNGYFKGGTIYNAYEHSSYANYFDSRFDARHHINANYSLGMKYDVRDDFHISANVEYIDSRATMYSMTVYNSIKNNRLCYYPANSWSGPSGCYNDSTPAAAYYFPNAPVINVTSDFSDGSPSITYNDAGWTGLADASNYLWAAAMDHVENNYAHSWATRMDFTYDFHGGISDWLKHAEFGFRANLKEAATRHSRWNWGKLSFKTWSNGWHGGSSAALQVQAAGDFSDSLSSPYVQKYNFPSLFGTKMPAVYEPSLAWMEKGIDAVWGGLEPIINRATTIGGLSGFWSPLSVTAGCASGIEYKCSAIYDATTPSSNGGGINAQTENTYAGYMQFDYAHDTFLGMDLPIDGNIGVRIVHTQSDSGIGYLLLPQVTTCPIPATGTIDCTGRTEATDFVGNSGTALNLKTDAVKNDYTDILPSFNFRAHISDTLQLRAAYSQGIVRPDLAYTQNYTSLGFSFGSGTLAGTISDRTGSGGNPYLKPLRANNYDISLEWFFAPTGNLSFAMFHKDITNYFKSGIEYDTYVRNGYTETFRVTRYQNGDKGKVEGAELSYQQFYDSLPGFWGGFGVQANYTKIYNHGGSNSPSAITTGTNGQTNVALASNGSLPMEGMSNDSANIALLYAKYGIDARLAYNWRSRFLVNSSATNLNQPVFQRNYGQFDFSAIYSFLDHYKVGFQVNNLFKQTTVLEIGGYPTLAIDKSAPYEWVEGERKLSLVLRASW